MHESFIMIPISNLKIKKNKNLMILLGLLESNSQKLGYAYGTNKYYADILGCTTRTISTLLKELLNLKYIEIENPKSFKRKIYVRNKLVTM